MKRKQRYYEAMQVKARSDEYLSDTLWRIEREFVKRALEDHDGARAKTAEFLGVTREGLYKKMVRFELE
ncbi:MAG: helix-turn-helix domain-containing protein [Myxococcota bacterium]|nr:helix-turn-helix domain-containing protein [Myxococcota bacterium]